MKPAELISASLLVLGALVSCAHGECTWRDNKKLSIINPCLQGEFMSHKAEKTTLCCMLEQCYFAGTAPACDKDNECHDDECTLAETDVIIKGSGRCRTGTSRRLCCGCGFDSFDFNVTLFGNTKFKGWKEVHHENHTSCMNIEGAEGAASIDTRDTCVRVYDEQDCIGRTRAVKPDTPSHGDLTKLLDGNNAKSLGSCFKSDMEKDNDWSDPDTDTNRIGNKFAKPVSHDWGPDQPRPVFQLGFKNRTEAMHVDLVATHIGTGCDPGPKATEYAHKLGHSDDVAGNLLPAILGGNCSDEANLFPQNAAINANAYRNFHHQIAENLAVSGNMSFTVNLVYDSGSSLRPVAVRFRCVDASGRLVEQFLNP